MIVKISKLRFKIFDSLQVGDTIYNEEREVEGSYTVPDEDALDSLLKGEVPKGAKAEIGPAPDLSEPKEPGAIPQDVIELAARMYMEKKDAEGQNGGDAEQTAQTA